MGSLIRSLNTTLINIINNKIINDQDMFEFIFSVSQVDRYQASNGIATVAEMIKNKLDALERGIGNLQKFYLPEKIKAWTFCGAKPWDPQSAHIEIINDNTFNFDYHKVPFLLATNSAEYSIKQPLLECIVDPMPLVKLDNKIIIATKDYIKKIGHLDFLINSNVSGIITDYNCKIVDGKQYYGRLELPDNSKCFAFSLTTENINYLLQKKMNYGQSMLKLNIKLKSEKDKFMPLLDYTIPGTSNKEIWIISHICHGRPGANDNASGNLALFILAKLFSLNKDILAHTLRFIWMPEFIGTAVYLHELNKKRNSHLPVLVINCDMLIRAKKKKDSLFILEESPLHVPSVYSSLVNQSAKIVETIFKKTDFKLHVGSFKGRSDHLLFVDSYTKVPSVQFTQQPDPYNHSSGDTILNYEFLEIKKPILMIYLSIYMLTHKFGNENKDLLNIICCWKIKELTSFLANDIIYKLITHAKEKGIKIKKEYVYRIKFKSLINSIFDIKNFHPEITSDDLHQILFRIKNKTHINITKYKENSIFKEEKFILRLWHGPFNLRAALNVMSLSTANKIKVNISENNLVYSKIVAIAISINNRIGKTELWINACLNINELIDLNFFEYVLSCLENIDWIKYANESECESREATYYCW